MKGDCWEMLTPVWWRSYSWTVKELRLGWGMSLEPESRCQCKQSLAQPLAWKTPEMFSGRRGSQNPWWCYRKVLGDNRTRSWIKQNQNPERVAMEPGDMHK